MTNMISGVPNLINGVSQQPAGQRLPSQCELQENCYISLVSGLSKRHPTEWITQLFASASAPELHVHFADRGDNDGGSGTERYIFTFRDNEIRCWEINGTEIIVHDVPSTPAQTYQYIECGTEDPNKLLRTLTVLDHTFIVRIRSLGIQCA